MDIEKLLYINFCSLKEFCSSESLGINNRDMYVCKIPYFEEDYYLIVNPKRQYIKVTFKDNDKIEFPNRVFISKKEVSFIEVLIDSPYNLTSSRDSIATFNNLEDKEKLYVKYNFKMANQEIINSYFQNENLIKEDELKDHLFKLKIDEKFKEYITNTPMGTVQFHIEDNYIYNLAQSKFSNGYLFTNRHQLALRAVSKMSAENDKIPFHLLNQSKIIFKSNIAELELDIEKCVTVSKIDKVNTRLKEILSNLGE